MSSQFRDLSERLLRAGVAPRHVRRYLCELADHLADLRAAGESAGLSPAQAEAAALAQLGKPDDLAHAMIQKRQFQSWSARAPWAVFGIAPLLLLMGAYFVICFYLWCGWQLFLPGANTPFGTPIQGPIYGLANIYFQAGKFCYFAAPVLVGWGIGMVAARQRLGALWPILSLACLAGMGATAQIQASRSALPHALGHIRMQFFSTPTAHSLIQVLVWMAITLTIGGLPYLLWRIRTGAAVS